MKIVKVVKKSDVSNGDNLVMDCIKDGKTVLDLLKKISKQLSMARKLDLEKFDPEDLEDAQGWIPSAQKYVKTAFRNLK